MASGDGVRQAEEPAPEDGSTPAVVEGGSSRDSDQGEASPSGADESIPVRNGGAASEEAETVEASPTALRGSDAHSLSGGASLSASLPGSLGKTRTWGTTAVSAVHAEEAARAAGFGRAIAILCVMGLGVQPFVPAPPSAPWLKWLLIVAIAYLAGVGVWVHLRARDESRYTPRVFRVFAFSCVAASTVVEYHAGIFSPAPLAVTLGISFFGLGNDRSVAIGAPVAAAAAGSEPEPRYGPARRCRPAGAILGFHRRSLLTYRALTGRPPFSGRDTPQILFDIVYRMPARPSEVIKSLPADLELVLAIALAKRPEDRFASALELSAALSLASKGALDSDTRARAQALVARNPWGRSVLEVEGRSSKVEK